MSDSDSGSQSDNSLYANSRAQEDSIGLFKAGDGVQRKSCESRLVKNGLQKNHSLFSLKLKTPSPRDNKKGNIKFSSARGILVDSSEKSSSSGKSTSSESNENCKKQKLLQCRFRSELDTEDSFSGSKVQSLDSKLQTIRNLLCNRP